MRRRVGLILIVILLAGIAVVYKYLDPSVVPIFPRCPFRLLTGYLCPGCGSQRAIHHLLNLDLPGAWRMNPLLVIALPYLLLGLILKPLSHHSARGALLGLIVLMVIAYFVGSDAPLRVGVDAQQFNTPSWLKLADMCMFTIYALIVINVLALIVTSFMSAGPKQHASASERKA